MKLALERLVDAKRVLMRDGDQYVIMNFAMIEDDKQKIGDETKPGNEENFSKERLERKTFRREVNI